MSKMINIAKTDEKPLYIDPTDITALHVNPTEGTMRLYNSKGEILWVTPGDWNLDVADVIQKLADHGKPLVYFPSHWDGVEYPIYIAPDAVTFATVSQPGKDGTIGTIIGVKGVGREENYGVTQTKLDAFLKAVRATKTLLEYSPEEVSSRWSYPAGLYIDPASVTQIREDAIQVIVCFERSGSLDIQPKMADNYPMGVYEMLMNSGMTEAEAGEKTIQWQDERDAREKRVRDAFANKLAAASGTLLAIPSSERALYVKKEDIEYVSFAQYAGDNASSPRYLSIEFKKVNGSRYGDNVMVPFNTDAERLKALELLIAADTSKPAKRKPKAPKKSGPQR